MFILCLLEYVCLITVDFLQSVIEICDRKYTSVTMLFVPIGSYIQWNTHQSKKMFTYSYKDSLLTEPGRLFWFSSDLFPGITCSEALSGKYRYFFFYIHLI